jgi:hypothetical protein
MVEPVVIWGQGNPLFVGAHYGRRYGPLAGAVPALE